MTTSSTGLSSLGSRISRLSSGFLLLIAASLLAVLQATAWAQAPAQQGAYLDPPGRVARLNLTEGAVSFAPADSTAWTPAVLNRPLTGGDKLWTGPRARSELHIGSTAVRMNEQTSLDFLILDDNVIQLRLAQGTLQLRVRTLFEGQRLEVNTPNLAFVISQPGEYRLDVNPASNTTRVVAQSGSGVIYGDGGASVNLGSQQQATFTDTQLTPAAPGAALQDSFDAWAADRDRREDQSVSARYVPRETVGYQQLDAYGDWRQDPTYGAVWLPHAVPVNWAPYRMGHWSWIPPWGWTWVDDAPWGFAPCHYGRWARIGPHWAWVPGRLAARPVYAPALVVFVGGTSGGVSWNISISSGIAPQPAIGWFPLAPGEAFLPVYAVSPRYITQVNQNIVVNSTVNVTNIIYRYQRQPAAVTVVSRDNFIHGRPVRGNLHTLSTTDLSRAQVVTERSAMPQRLDRADVRERPRPVAAAALPPAAVVARPVVGSRDERRDERRGESREVRHQDRAQAPVPAAPVTAGVMGAQPPAAKPGPAMPPALHPIPAPAQDRSAIDAEHRARREQLQLQREQERQLREQTRQQDVQRRQSEESLGQRALREQAQKNGSAPPPMPDARAAAERDSALQAQRAQQQLQRDQQRQQRELIHQQEQQRLQSEESLGQRAMREQAQKQQEQARQQQALQQQQQQLRVQQEQQQIQRDQQRQQRELIHQQEQQRLQNEESLSQRAMREQAQKQQEQARQQQALQQQQQQQQQQQIQRDQQRQQRELIHQQEQQRRQSEESLGQRALREQAQKQQEQARQQQALQQQQQQQQHRAQQEQQRQAREQPQEQRKEQAQERQQKRQADDASARGLRPEGGPNRNREQ